MRPIVCLKTKCPRCKQNYEIRRSNLKRFVFYDRLVLLDKIDDQFVARVFELRSDYNNNTKYFGFDRSTVEYARFIPNEYNTTFVNERVSKCTGSVYIYHYWGKQTDWRLWTRYYGPGTNGLVYPYNLKALFKGTEYQYSMLWELVKHIDYAEIENLLNNSRNYPNVELLVKAKLYNLALRAMSFNSKGNFESIFEVPKAFYTFMKKHNINYDELERLRILKEPNIKDVRYLLDYNTNQLEDVCKYIRIKDFLKYARSKKGKLDVWMYKDYLKFASILGFDLKNKKYMFPKNLREEHDKLEKQVDINNKKLLNKAIARRLEELNQNTFKDKTYIIFPAKNVAALEDESNQQGNCVRTYSEGYAAGECDIYFLRELANTKKSLVTVEVQHNKVVQKETKHHGNLKSEYLKLLNTWENKVLSKAA